MKIGTKSVLFGVHCFFIHPYFVLRAWCRLYGPPENLQTYLAIFLHDFGYIGKPNMDGPEGEKHPEFGAKIMLRLYNKHWHDFVLTHSRYYAKKLNMQPSRLCIADKLAFACDPYWFYIIRAKISGEINEYFNNTYWDVKSTREWHKKLRFFMLKYVAAHRNGEVDNVTNIRN